MNWLLIIPIVAVLLMLRWRQAPMLVWFAAWWLGAFVFIRYGFVVPIPVSVVKLYMGIISGSLITYVLTDRQRIGEVVNPLVAFISERRYTAWLAATVVLLPALFAWQIYAGMTRDPIPPAFARTVHPAPPDAIIVDGEEVAVGTVDNPYRHLEESDPQAFAEHVASGRVVYYENCFYCHGDLMSGEGMFAHALNPIPSNFQDPGTIAMLREAFLFWRIAKGGPGLPEEGGPWASAMPAWESFLTGEEMWDVVLFLYEFTGQSPRAVEELH